MTFKDWTQSLLDKVKTGGIFGSQGDGMESNMANGGFSGYKPATARQHTMRQTQQQPVTPEGQPADPMGGVNWEQPNQQSTGFTGMYSYTQGMGYQQPMNNAAPYQQPCAMPPMTGYQQPVGQPMGGAAWPDPYGAMDNSGMGAQPYGTMGAPGAYPGGATMNFQSQGMPGQQTSRYQAPGATPQDNIRYMPGSFVGDDGKAYSHVERVALVSNVAACYRIIEFMRNNESVIINTEQITDEAENQRCLDLLYGAAFAMKCSFTRIAMKSIYLIAPLTVMVVPYDAIRRMSDQDMSARWPEPEQESRWDRSYRSGGFTRSQQPYQTSRFRQDSDGSGRRGTYQDDYAGVGGYNAVGYGR